MGKRKIINHEEKKKMTGREEGARKLQDAKGASGISRQEKENKQR